MGIPLLFVKNVLAAKIEVTIGTAVALAAADATFKAYEANMKLGSDVFKRQQQAGVGNDTGVAGAEQAELTFKSHLHGKGSAGVPAWASTFLPCCGLLLTASTFSGTSDTSQWKSLTAGHYQDGRRKRGRGMMGSFKLSGKSGMPGELDWTFMGASDGDPSDVAILTGMSYESVKPPIFQGASSFVLAGASTFPISEISFDLGNDVALREDPNSTRGFLSAFIGDRKPTITLDPEATLFATKNWPAIYSANTEIAIVAVWNGGASNTITLSATVQLEKQPEDQNRNGKLVDALGLQINADSLTIAFT
jgi:hypothetical protein